MDFGKLIPTALLLAGTTMALAQNAPPAGNAPGAQGGPGGGMRMDPAERFKQLDKNGDGKISLEEFQAMRMGMGRNGGGGGAGGTGGPPAAGGQGAAGGQAAGGQGGGADGNVGRGMRMDPAERFKTADKNGDGFLSLEEFTAMMPMRRGGAGGGG